MGAQQSSEGNAAAATTADAAANTPVVAADAAADAADTQSTPVAGSGPDPESRPLNDAAILVLYGSQWGKGKALAESLPAMLPDGHGTIVVKAMSEVDPEILADTKCAVLITSSVSGGAAPDNAEFFTNWLREATSDWRVGCEFLHGCRYAVFGLGDSEYSDDGDFNRCARDMDLNLGKLGALRLCACGVGDDRERGATTGAFAKWVSRQLAPSFSRTLQKIVEYEKVQVAEIKAAEEAAEAAAALEPAAVSQSDDDSEEEDCYNSDDDDVKGGIDVDKRVPEEMVDVEEMGAQYAAAAAEDAEEAAAVEAEQDAGKKADKRTHLQAAHSERVAAAKGLTGPVPSAADAKKSAAEPKPLKPMLNDKTRAALQKQGYKTIGTHSGVKLCRWTKNMLRGRGGCYKHTFYGIASHQCMEMTPSLACANKCVFCWRHNTNPVGKKWKWEVDSPAFLVEHALQKHRQMIKEFRGVPGVLPQRLADGAKPRHCALSLVGEPIMYPHINEFMNLLHDEGISTFLVTNAQFPEAIENLVPVTQLYVSVDASTKDTLKKIDRPLHKDFWERFQSSLASLKRQRVRSVYRITLVREWNMDAIREYAELVAVGAPTFIEIKGMTAIGKGHESSSLTIDANMPFHYEVRKFTLAMAAFLSDDYEVACEHEHSCCMLIAHKSLKVDGKWRTWIDYDKFNELQRKWRDSDGKETFEALDYCLETPSWAVFGADERGFDPNDTRFRKAKQIRNAWKKDERMHAQQARDKAKAEGREVTEAEIAAAVEAGAAEAAAAAAKEEDAKQKAAAAAGSGGCGKVDCCSAGGDNDEAADAAAAAAAGGDGGKACCGGGGDCGSGSADAGADDADGKDACCGGGGGGDDDACCSTTTTEK